MKSLNVVLVRPKYPRNIGMAARALANFSVNRLILIDPKCELDVEAREGAAQAQEPLQKVTQYKNWEDFYAKEPEGPRIAFSRRSGKRRASEPLKNLLTSKFLDWRRPIFLIFGTEDHGLSQEDLNLAHRICYFDLPGNFLSMNLSHAVVHALTHFYMFSPNREDVLMEHEEILSPEPSLRLWLETLNFDLETHPRWNALTMLQKLILKGAPSRKEIELLDSVIHQTVRKLGGANGMKRQLPPREIPRL